MASLRAEYVKERENTETLEIEDKGFLEYAFGTRYNKYVLFIKNLYVKPEYRRTGIGSRLGDMAEDIAVHAGCDAMLSCVEFTDNVRGQVQSMMAVESFGFVKHEYDANKVLYYLKDLRDGMASRNNTGN